MNLHSSSSPVFFTHARHLLSRYHVSFILSIPLHVVLPLLLLVLLKLHFQMLTGFVAIYLTWNYLVSRLLFPSLFDTELVDWTLFANDACRG